jgi:hypothetical protein
MNTQEAISVHKQAIDLLKLIKQAESNYRASYWNTAQYKRSGLSFLATKETRRAETLLADIVGLREKYNLLIKTCYELILFP